MAHVNSKGCKDWIFSHLCLYEKLLSYMTMLVLGTIHLKVGEKESIMSVHAG